MASMVSFHNFKSQILKLSVSNPKSKYVVYLSVLSQISNYQGLGRKNKDEILKTVIIIWYCITCCIQYMIVYNVFYIYIYIYMFIHMCVYVYIYIYTRIDRKDFQPSVLLVPGRNRFGSICFSSGIVRTFIGSVRFGQLLFPLRCGSACVFRTRRGSVRFDSVRFRFRFRPIPGLMGSVRPVRFGWLFLPVVHG